jgi:UDP-glucuronate 4-epimerase
MKTILLTGCAGFIGWRTASLLLEKGARVFGVDNLNNYYSMELKNRRLKELTKHSNFDFTKADIEDKSSLAELFKKTRFDSVINLAARAGVRYSMENPGVYLSTNALGVINILELMKEFKVEKFILASTSSLYAGEKMPFNETLPVNTPISPYAATKKAAEALSYAYHFIYGINITILRYFTVYGPFGRPDMSIFRFIKWINEGSPVEIYGDGTQSRDFTYIDDIAEGTIKAEETARGYEIINLGNNQPYDLNHVISLIEKYSGKKAVKKNLPPSKVDVKTTRADISKAEEVLGWKPAVSLEEGVKRSVSWYSENRKWLEGIKL